MTPSLHRFRPRLLDALRGYGRASFFADLGAGLTVAVVALPLAMAFAIASGLPPQAGLVSAIVGGFIVSALGGVQLQIAGPAGAFIVIVYGIVERHGVANLLLSTFFAGWLLVLMGWLRLGGWVRLVPVSIVIGFTNGIAVLIALSQLKDLLGLPVAKMPADFFAQLATLGQHLSRWNPWALAMGGLCFVGLWLWPRLWAERSPLPAALRQSRLANTAGLLPGPLVALVTMTAVATWFSLPLDTVGSRFGALPSGLPALRWPEFSWAAAKELVAPTLTIAFLGAVESLLCARVSDRVAPQHPRHEPNQELMAQGLANAVVPLMGGLPVTGTMARTVTNIRAGARTPVAGLLHALVLVGIVAMAAPLAQMIPLAALAGILLFVAWNMGEWHEFARLRQFALPYRVTLLATFVTTVVLDLTLAVGLGLVLACLFFIYRMASEFGVEAVEDPALPAGSRLVRLHGSLFFGSADALEALPAQMPAGTRRLVMDAQRLVFMDSSGLEALRALHKALAMADIQLIVAHAQGRPLDLMCRTGFAQELGLPGPASGLEEALASPMPAPKDARAAQA
jgi:sulfate permease, SulP family